MDIEEDEKYKKIAFAIRMLNFHKFITTVQFIKMVTKLEKLIIKEQEMSIEEANKYLESIW